MTTSFRFAVRVVDEQDRDWVSDLLNSHWGGEYVVVHGKVFYPQQLAGFIAEIENNKTIGLITYQIHNSDCEIITLNSLVENRGVGSMLIEVVADAAYRQGCDTLRLTTTNDNQRAIDFYKRRGFGIKEIRKGAVDQARSLKPTIPHHTPAGIPIQDEWEFEKKLTRRIETSAKQKKG